ncbi:probable fibrosin-1 isoform X3 [Varanus komodoensis]|uniref:probable fibrosin-1 isoform X3 n=1 Tax=Varanus komodoensis TaxID=61221 RepID=UPI001CF77A52|nr:probable fibrosin-1 isoform X3 [Varanus komodoensis]
MEGTAAASALCWSGGGGSSSRTRRKRRCSRRDRESRCTRRRGGRPGDAPHCGLSSSSSSGSDSEGPSPPAPVAPGKGRPLQQQQRRRRRPLRRRKRASGSSCSRDEEEEEEEEEEDLIDGFAIASFVSLEALEKDATLKTPERLELRMKHSGKRKRGEGNNSEPEDEDGSSEKGCAGERARRKRNKRRHKEPSLQSYLETGYICDTESDPEEQASVDDLEQSFTVSTSKASGPIGALNGSCEAKLSVIPKVSGLERSQERNYEADRDPLLVPFLPKEPPSQAAAAPVPAQALPPSPPAPPPSRTRAQTPNTLHGTPQPKGQLPPTPQGGAVPHNLTQSQLHMKVPPFTSQTQAPYAVGLDLSTGGCSRGAAHPKPILPPCSPSSSQLPHRPSTPSLALPPHAFSSTLRPPSHHPGMFTPSPGLPPPPPLLQVAGHPAAAAAISEQELIRQDLSSRFLTAQGSADMGATAIRPLAFQFHQHNHQHQHTHQHTHQHFTPFPPGMVPTPSPAMFDKYPGKMDGILRHNLYTGYSPTVSGISPVLPPAVTFGSLQGAFQPKSTNPDLPSRLATVPPSLAQKGTQLSDPFRPTLRKPGKWCAMHVRVAYMILRHQEKMKLMQGDPHKLDFRNDLLTGLPGTGAFGSLPHGQELARPATLFTASGVVHPGSGSSFGPASTPHGSFLSPSPHIDPFGRPPSFASLGALSNGAFGGLGNPSFNSTTVFGQKDSPGAIGFPSPHETWNRLHRTPPSFPTAPAWPKGGTGDGTERGSTQHDKETEKPEGPVIKDEKDRDALFSRHPLRASPATPTPKNTVLAHEEPPGRPHVPAEREHRYGSPASSGHASRSPYPELPLKKEVKLPLFLLYCSFLYLYPLSAHLPSLFLL